MTVLTDRDRIEEVFNRGIVSEVLPSKEGLIKRMADGERLKIYIGADPTSDSLHLSHAKNYMFLEELRQLGHEVVVLVGDFTAQIGDPTNKTATRVQMSKEQVEENVKKWVSQIKPLINFEDKNNPPQILYNSKWLSEMSLKDVTGLAANFTVQQMLARDMFTRRIKEDNPIYLHEFLYPLMQGYDSVALDVDVELCGTDQIFNALAGRTLLKRLKNKDKFIIAVNLMENPKTKELMSKSRGTGVFLSSSPKDMYGAIMAQPDEMIEVLFINCTRIPLSEKDNLLVEGPRDAKAKIALDIVTRFYGEKEAKGAQDEFEKVFSEGKNPDEIKEVENKENITQTMVAAGTAISSSEAKRLIDQKAVKVNNKVISDWGYKLKKGDVVKVGSRKFIRIE